MRQPFFLCSFINFIMVKRELAIRPRVGMKVYRRGANRNRGAAASRRSAYAATRRVGRANTSAYSVRSARSVFPAVLRTALTYADSVTITASSLGKSGHTFAANSLFDPDVTGTGSQPRYYDSLCGANGGTAPYHYYLVSAVKAVAFVRNLSTVHMFVSLSMFTASATAPATLQEAREREDTVVAIVSPKGGGASTTKLSMYRALKNMLGVKDLLDDPDAGATYNANPNSLCYVVFQAYNPDGVGSSSVTADMALTYYSAFRRKNDVADS